MVASPPSTGAFARHVMNPLGFTKAYNFWLYVIFGGAFVGCTSPRIPHSIQIPDTIDSRPSPSFLPRLLQKLLSSGWSQPERK